MKAAGIVINLDDPDYPTIEFRASTGKRVLFGLHEIGKTHQAGAFASAAIDEWILDQSSVRRLDNETATV